MKGFWTCGPFKQFEDRIAQRAFKMEQMEHLMAELIDLSKGLSGNQRSMKKQLDDIIKTLD